jgi:hypothetical protein
MANKTSQHILNTAANLLGFCLFVITSFHVANYSEASVVDELTSIIAVALVFSCILSFISIRTENPKIEFHFEKVADYLFLGSLIGLLVIIALIALNFIK